MIDDSKIWMVIENNEEMEYAKKLLGDIKEYLSLVITYKQLRELLKLDLIQIGDYKGQYVEILGYIKINGYIFSVEGFSPKTILNNKYFKPFLRRLIQGLKLGNSNYFTFYYSEKSNIVVVEVENRKGLFACAYWSD